MATSETAANPQPGRPLAHMLALLVVSILIPAALLTGTLIWRIGRLDREKTDQQALQLARGVSGDLDREVEGSIETLLALAASTSMKRPQPRHARPSRQQLPVANRSTGS